MRVNKEAANKDVEQPSVGTLELVPLDEGDHGRDTHNTQSHEEGTGEPSIAPARKTSHWKFVGLTMMVLGLCIGITSDYYAGNQGSSGVSSGHPPTSDSTETVVLLDSTIGGEAEDYGAGNALAKEGRQSQSKPDGSSYYVDLGGCGGSLIAPNVVLTAKECGSNLGEIVKVGAHDRKSTDPKSVLVAVVEGIDKGNFKLLRLSEDVEIESPLAFLSLDDRTFGPPGNEQLTVMGFQITGNGNSNAPDKLREVDVNVFDADVCEASFGSQFDPFNSFCAGDSKGGKISCEGDSGSPVIRKEGNEHILVGVVSTGVNCGNWSSPGLYYTVGSELSWIKSIACSRWNATGTLCPTAPGTSPKPVPTIPTPLPTPMPTPSPTRSWPRRTFRFWIVPLEQPATCDGWLTLKARTNKIGHPWFGRDIEGSRRGCNAITDSNQTAYEILLPGDLGDLSHLVEMYYNGHSRSCWSTTRGFYIEGASDDLSTSQDNKCIQLRRMKKRWYKCSNKEGYNFNVIGYHKDGDGKVRSLDINVKDNGATTCDWWY